MELAESESDEENRCELEVGAETLGNLRFEIVKAQEMLEKVNYHFDSVGGNRNNGGSGYENAMRRDNGGRGGEKAQGQNSAGRGDAIAMQRNNGGGDSGDRDGGGRNGSGRDGGGRESGGREGDGDRGSGSGRGVGSVGYDEIASENGGFSSPGFNMAKEMLMDKVDVRSWIAQ
ncbi:glycine-rich cell wall structural protein 1.0-like [Drosophila rhopaloa]|uniref:Uncharacterized protein n=1 Tax=Drosophila rhopaloa TaxID=1041015 RepID=A0ABM5J676_DRORH|nr:glycine-rich cell wall structural protein 1.0-like [Drosophila rhopaloa]